MTSDWLLAGETLIWLVAIGVIVVWQGRRRIESAGLVLAYLLNLWLIHWPGAALYVLPWYSNLDLGLVESGFRQSTYAVMAFAAGSVLLAPIIVRRLSSAESMALAQRVPTMRLDALYLLWGLVSYLVLIPLVGRTPTATAIVGAGWNMLATGLGLTCWRAWSKGGTLAFLASLFLAGCLPLLTVVTQGFLGSGTAAFLAVLTFVKTFRTWPRWRFLAAGILFTYLGLSGYGSYMRDRMEIREVVWGGDSLPDRIERVYQTVRNLEWFDPYDHTQLSRIDDRLNQNTLVGAAIAYLDSGGEEFAGGETIWQAALALVPRVIWPSKPIVAGSMDLASRYTGLVFDEDTSVGLGQVLEFYINFGTIGVVLGFLTFGVLITVVDSKARRCLVRGDWQGFALWYVPSLSLLVAGGSLVDMTASVGAAVLNVLLVNHLLLRLVAATTMRSGGRPGPSGPRVRRSGRPIGLSVRHLR